MASKSASDHDGFLVISIAVIVVIVAFVAKVIL
jgi:hypothetical protein